MNKYININCGEPVNLSRLQYVIDFINNHPLKPDKIRFVLNDINNAGINIFYSKVETEGLFIPLQDIFFSNKKPNGKYYLNRYVFEETPIYSVENTLKEEEFFVENGNYAFDIFETVFFHISRYEEVYCRNDQLDIHKRMKSGEQLLCKNNVHQTPVVDLLINTFFKSLGFGAKDKHTTYSLTHDIDIIRKYRSPFSSIKSIAKSVQMGLGAGGALRIIKSIFSSIRNPQNDPYYTYDWLFVKDSKFIHKTVFFVAGGKMKYDLYDERYYNELPEIIEQATKKSYKTGYHPSYNAYNNKELFAKEYSKLAALNGNKINYIRTHYLRLDIQKTFELIEESGIEYDSTLGYADDIGFRCGTGFEYFPYNFKEERAWNFKELPLVFMDSSLIYNKCNDKVDCFILKAEQFFEKNKFNTHIMINFHNSTFDHSLSFREGLKEAYLKIIAAL